MDYDLVSRLERLRDFDAETYDMLRDEKWRQELEIRRLRKVLEDVNDLFDEVVDMLDFACWEDARYALEAKRLVNAGRNQLRK